MIEQLSQLFRSMILPTQINPLLLLGMLLIGGLFGGWLARRAHLPSITGNILAGVILGPYALGRWLGITGGETTIESFQPISTFAMGLISVAIGGHLSYRRIHNALVRIVLIALFEVTLAVVLVVLAFRYFDTDWPTALLLGALSAATAPATIVAIIRENRAKGSLVKTLLSVVAIDNILAIALFAVFVTFVAEYFQNGATPFTIGPAALVDPLWTVLGSSLLGLMVGYTTRGLVGKYHSFSTVFMAVLVCTGLAPALGLSPLMTSVFFGIYLGNSSRQAEEQLRALEPIEPLLYVLFFTLAGVTLHLDKLPEVGLAGAIYVIVRILGKSLGAICGGLLAGSSQRLWSNLSLGLVPQAGVALALVVILEGDDRIPLDIRQYIGTLVLAAVVVNEIIGPFFTRRSITRSGEADKDRPRLMEFLEEEFIKTDLVARDKWDAIRQLTDFLARTHRVEHIDRKALYRSIVEREKAESTAIGHGAAMPHGIIDRGPAIQGVLGICRDGLDFGGDQGEPVRLIMLIVTPRDHREQHLRVMASLAAMISDKAIRSRLINALDPNDAWEVIESEEARGYNYFLES